jgi:hypothetical protein
MLFIKNLWDQLYILLGIKIKFDYVSMLDL